MGVLLPQGGVRWKPRAAVASAAAPSRGPMPKLDDRTAWRWALILVGAAAMVRLLVLAITPLQLYPDEAQYWLWAQSPAAGYVSKPPMVAWLIAVSTALADGEFWVRLPAVLIHAATALVLFKAANRMAGRDTAPYAGLLAAALWVLAPAVAVSSLFISTDAPLALFLIHGPVGLRRIAGRGGPKPHLDRGRVRRRARPGLPLQAGGALFRRRSGAACDLRQTGARRLARLGLGRGAGRLRRGHRSQHGVAGGARIRHGQSYRGGQRPRRGWPVVQAVGAAGVRGRPVRLDRPGGRHRLRVGGLACGAAARHFVREAGPDPAGRAPAGGDRRGLPVRSRPDAVGGRRLSGPRRARRPVAGGSADRPPAQGRTGLAGGIRARRFVSPPRRPDCSTRLDWARSCTACAAGTRRPPQCPAPPNARADQRCRRRRSAAVQRVGLLRPEHRQPAAAHSAPNGRR